MDDWYSIQNTGLNVTIEFQVSESRYWDPSILTEKPLCKDWFSGRVVRICGPGATWMYAHAMAVATAGGASSVSLKSITPVGVSENLDACSLKTEANGSLAVSVLSAFFRSSELLSDAAISTLARSAVQKTMEDTPRSLCLTGKAPLKFYAECCELAVRQGINSIYCFVPQYGLVSVFRAIDEQVEQSDSDPEEEVERWLEAHFYKQAGGMVIGIVGDPNVGKSVFSIWLDRWREQFELDGWRLDCDGQAPTPPWYIQHENSGDPQFARDQRKKLKRDWCSEMERELASQLGEGKRSLDYLIADLPGGDHRIEPADRIPQVRERMFQWVNKFIIVQRADRLREREWIDSLRAIGKDHEVVAVVTSEEPDEVLEMKGELVDGIWRGRAKGLDRRHLKQTFESGTEEAFRTVWGHLVTE